MTARYHVKVHARNRHAGLGIPVTVYADNRRQATRRAIEIGWSGEPRDAVVTVLSVDDMPPADRTSEEADA